MADTIDSLQIEIDAKATKANDAIDRLVGKLDRLTTSLGRVNGTNLNGLANGVQRLGSAMQVMNTIKTADFTRLATNLTKLGTVNVSALNSAASSMSHLTRAFNSLGTVSANAQAVGEMAKNIAKLGNKSVQTAIANIPQLATAMNNLMTTLSRSPQVSQNVIQMTNALANLASQGSKVGSASNSIVRGLNRTSTSANTARKSFGGLASAIGKFYATYFMVIRGLKGLWSSIESTADYIEAYNYFNVALGKIGSDWSHQFEKYGYDNAESYADSFGTRLSERLGELSGLQVTLGADGKGLLTESGMKNLGLNIQEITQYASQLASVTNSVGQTGEVSLAVASSFTKLAGDISSLFNVDYSSVSKNLQSGLIGQSRALYKYGIDITNATLQTKAYELGLSKAVSEMTQAEKMQLRMIAILDQSKVSWGDLANTINSPSNMIRQFKNNLKETGMVLGQLFIPALQKVLPFLNGFTIAVKNFLVSIAKFLNIKIDFDAFGQGYSDVGDEVEGVADAYDDATSSAKKFKSVTLGIDELNINAPQEDGGGGSGNTPSGGGIDLTDEIIKATEEYEKVWNEAFKKMESKVQEFSKKITSFLSPALNAIRNFLKNAFSGNFLAAGINVSQFVNSILDMIQQVLNAIDFKKIGEMFGNFFYGSLAESFKGFGKISSIISSVIIGINEFLTSAIQSVDWKDVTVKFIEGVREFIQNIDILNIIKTLTDVTTSINDALFSIISGLFENPDDLAGLVGDLLLKIFELGIGTLSSSVNIIAELIFGWFDIVLSSAFEKGYDFGVDFSEWLNSIVEEGINAFKNGEFSEWISEKFKEAFDKAKEKIDEFKENFEPLVSFLKESFGDYPDWFKEKFTEVGENIISPIMEKTKGIADWFNKNVIKPILKFFEPFYTRIKQIFTGLWTIVKAVWIKASSWFNSTVIEPIKNAFSAFKTTVQQIFTGLWIIIKAVWIVVSGWFNENVISPLINFFSPIIEKISGFFSSLWEKIKETWQSVSDWFNETIISPVSSAFEEACENIKGFFSSLWESIKKGVGSPMNVVISAIEKGLNVIIDGINKIIGGFNKVVSWAAKVAEVDWGGVDKLERVSLNRIDVSGYQYGGFPEPYSLFAMNEGGNPEWIGDVGGRTGVVSNGEITGIRDAIYDTSREEISIMREEINLLKQLLAKNTSINIGDREIARANARGQKSLGYSVVV